MLKKKWVWGVVVALIIIILAVVNINSLNKATEVTSVKVTEGTIIEQIYTNGKLEAKRTTEIYSPVSGVVESVSVKLGDVVKKGQSLLTLSMEEISDQLAKEQINLELAEAERLSAKKQHFEKFKQSIIDDPSMEMEDLNLTQFDLRIKSSKLTIASLEKRLNNSSVNAAEDGVVTHISVNKGQLITEGSGIVTVSDLSSYNVKAYLNELDAGKVSMGMSAVVTGESITGTYNGQVSYLAKMAELIDPASKDATVEMTVELGESSPELRPGYNVTIEMVIPDKLRLLVPMEAIQYTGDQPFVFKVHEGRAVKTVVTTGKESEDQIEILTGVGIGEEIAVEGAELLRDGDKVKLR